VTYVIPLKRDRKDIKAKKKLRFIDTLFMRRKASHKKGDALLYPPVTEVLQSIANCVEFGDVG